MDMYCVGQSRRNQKIILFIFYIMFWDLTGAIHPDCAIIGHLRRARQICDQTRRREARNHSGDSGVGRRCRSPYTEIVDQLCPKCGPRAKCGPGGEFYTANSIIPELCYERPNGCRTEWDQIRCWPRADVGQVVNASCSEIFQHFYSDQGYVVRNCTADGWTEPYPSYEEACTFNDDSGPESETMYLSTFRQVYTVGYATSLISLITAIVVFTAFRKFHCTRNYIHINLFSSFVLRASAVFIKDTVLFADETLDHCSMSTVSCKLAVAFFQFSILANYFWLLVEGMYLQTLLALTFVSQKKYFWWYILIGWGLPTTVLIIWVLARYFFDNKSCWDDTDNVGYWWIIKGPITASLLVNIVIFVNVIRILIQKLKSPAMGGSNDTGHFMRLAKSTLFLIPLFGMHYTVFAFLPENTGVAARLSIELGLGSFQGFVVALLYCFMNGEVQTELRRWLWRCYSQNHLTRGKQGVSLTQVTMLDRAGGGGGSRRPPSTSNLTTV